MTVTSAVNAWIHTAQGAHRLHMRVADRFLARLRGLMLARPLSPDMALLITGCTSVHTCFMRFPIDIVYLDGMGRVTQCVQGLKPWRASASPRFNRTGRTRHVLELPAGAIARLGIEPADRLQHSLWEEPPYERASSAPKSSAR